jgi:hypothetical protein
MNQLRRLYQHLHVRIFGMRINDEYCWMHLGRGYGGWTCKHRDCKATSKVYREG